MSDAAPSATGMLYGGGLKKLVGMYRLNRDSSMAVVGSSGMVLHRGRGGSRGGSEHAQGSQVQVPGTVHGGRSVVAYGRCMRSLYV